MSDLLYRFRSTKNLLDEFNELENQELYFSPPAQLNDPMEGFRHFFWTGDAIVWKNFLTHYLLCLEHCFSLAVIGGEQNPIQKSDIPIHKTQANFPTPTYHEMFEKICASFFADELIQKLPTNLAERNGRIRRQELIFHFSWIHSTATEAIYSTYEERGLLKKRAQKLDVHPTNFKEHDVFEALNKMHDEVGEAEAVLENLFSYQSLFNKQINLIARYNDGSGPLRNNHHFIFYEFPNAYTEEIERLVYADWYTACFMSECTNSSVWGHYGDNHKGACLVFNAVSEDGTKKIDLDGIYGYGSGGAIKGFKTYSFYKVDYERSHTEIDFFRSLGTMSLLTLNKYWYTDSEGNRSQCANDIAVDEEAWRKSYWEKFAEGVTTKTKDWKYENEYRLVLHGWLNDYSQKEDRKLRYRFNDLKGIIFGMKTTSEDKLKIMRIVESKCKAEGREKFEFYQAYYSYTKCTIEHAPMTFLKFD